MKTGCHLNQQKSLQKILEKSCFENSLLPQSSGELRFYLMDCPQTPTSPQHSRCGRGLQGTLLPPSSASAQGHSSQHVSVPRFRRLFEYTLSSMPSPSPLFLSCTKPSSTFCFHQRPHIVKCQSSGFYFRPSSSAGLGPAAPSRQPPQFPLIVPTARSLVPSLPHSPSRPERALLPRCMAKSVLLLPPALESTPSIARTAQQPPFPPPPCAPFCASPRTTRVVLLQHESDHVAPAFRPSSRSCFHSK